jgi:integrase
VSLPDNLYESGGYYTWRDPRTKRKYGLGRDREQAIDQAAEANTELVRPSLVERINVPAGRSFADFLPLYRESLKAKKLAPHTLTCRESHLRAALKALGDVDIGAGPEALAEVTRRCATFLDGYTRQGKDRMAKAVRATLVDVFAAMLSAGWLPAVNPAQVLKVRAPTVRRARLTLPDFLRIYEVAGTLDPWVCRSMELALVTLQRREDVALMTFRQITDGRLAVKQHKTAVRLRIPLELRLDAVGWSVGEIVARCRDDVVSPRLLHHTRHQGRAKPGQGVHMQTLTTTFAWCRDQAGIRVEAGKTPPTFHELRSLGIRLYQQQGYDPQALAGHKDAATTAVYLDDRGAEWIDVRSA